MKLSDVIFCFHPRFDTGTWTIAFAFANSIIFSALFVMVLSYSAPKCACPQIWEQLDILPSAYKALYVFLLLYVTTIMIVSVMAIYGAFKAQRNKLPFFVLLMICTEIATFAMSIFIFVQLAKIEEYLLFDNDTYWNMAKLILKEDLIESLEGIIDLTSNLLKQLLKIDMAQTLNLDTLMDAALKDWVLVVLGGVKRMMKVSAILLLIGINTFFITSILVVSSHYYKLKKGVVKSYSGVPGVIIQKAVLSSSARSTASECFSDWSGVPLKKMQSMKSKDYRNSMRRVNYIYDVDSLKVQEKFPKGDFL